MNDRIDLDDLHRRLQGFGTAMLTTVGADGHIHSRPMMTLEREGDDLVFVSASETEKVQEIRANPKVGVIYFRDRDNAYVTVSGSATLVTDQDAIRPRWQDAWGAWFPQGPEGTDLVLIRVTPQRVEFGEPQAGRLRVLFEEARERLTGERPQHEPPTKAELR